MEGQSKRPAPEAESPGSDVVLLIDESGSMHLQKAAVIAAVDKTMTALCKAVAAQVLDTKCVSVLFFNHECRQVLSNTLGGINAVLSDSQTLGLPYAPNGMTALYDAIVYAISQCAEGGTLLIATDGEDTASKRETKESATMALATAKDMRRLTIIYLAEGKAAAAEAAAFGVTTTGQPDNALSQALEDPAVLLQLSQSVAFE